MDNVLFLVHEDGAAAISVELSTVMARWGRLAEFMGLFSDRVHEVAETPEVPAESKPEVVEGERLQ